MQRLLEVRLLLAIVTLSQELNSTRAATRLASANRILAKGLSFLE